MLILVVSALRAPDKTLMRGAVLMVCAHVVALFFTLMYRGTSRRTGLDDGRVAADPAEKDQQGTIAAIGDPLALPAAAEKEEMDSLRREAQGESSQGTIGVGEPPGGK